MKDLTRNEFLALFQQLSKGSSKAQVCKSFGITEKDLQRQIQEFTQNEAEVSPEEFTLLLIRQCFIKGPKIPPNLAKLNLEELRLMHWLNGNLPIEVIAQRFSVEIEKLLTITALNGRIGRLYKKLGVHTRLHLRAVLLVIELNK